MFVVLPSGKKSLSALQLFIPLMVDYIYYRDCTNDGLWAGNSIAPVVSLLALIMKVVKFNRRGMRFTYVGEYQVNGFK